MGNNSIRTNLSKEDIISDINLMRGANASSQPIFLVVEGKDDIVFFQKRIKNDVNLYESFSGCVGVREIIEFFCVNNVIGVCDRDYDDAYTNEQIFFYDYNCLEMMLVSSDPVLSSVCTTCYAGKFSHAELRLQILNNLKLISILRKINFEDKIGINFNRMPINALYNKKKNNIDISKVKSALGDDIIVNKRSKIEQLWDQFVTYEHLLQLTNGHDFINYLQIVFEASKPPKSKSLNADMIFMALSIAFRKEEFTQTSIYGNLKSFESKCHLTILD